MVSDQVGPSKKRKSLEINFAFSPAGIGGKSVGQPKGWLAYEVWQKSKMINNKHGLSFSITRSHKVKWWVITAILIAIRYSDNPLCQYDVAAYFVD